MYKSVIEQINHLQKSRISSISFNNNHLNLITNTPLPTHNSGLYWIYTTHTDQDFLNATPSTKKGSVIFKDRINLHSSLNYVCNMNIEGFRVVYNGIGGVGKKAHGGLRERILQEFRGGAGTGSLAINDSSLNNLEHWRFSYILWSEIEFESRHRYYAFSKNIERLWRIHYGWPVLCIK